LLLALAAMVAGAGSAGAQTLETLSETYRSAPSPRSRAALAQYAQAHSKEESGGLAWLALAAGDLEARDWASAERDLKAGARHLTKLVDYVSALEAVALGELSDFNGAQKYAEQAMRSPMKSPMTVRAIAASARALIALDRPQEAAALVRDRYSELGDSKADLLLAQAAEASRDWAAAVSFCQRVYYLNPGSKEAGDAETALARLRERLGPAYPEAKADVMLARALRLMKTGQRAQARSELEELTGRLRGADRDLALVRIGVADYTGKNYAGAYRYLKGLKVSPGEADAERLYYIHLTARRQELDDEAVSIATALGRQYPQSRWRLEALLSAADMLVRTNEVERYERLYRACYETFPAETEAAGCHWRVAWIEYQRRGAGAAALLREHLDRFPASEKASAALYYLGRLSERARDYGSARAYLQEIAAHYPNSYYTVIARERLQGAVATADSGSSAARRFLDGLKLPGVTRPNFEMTAATRMRLDRARMLERVSLEDWSEAELRFGAKNDGQPHLIAMEMARAAQRRGAADQGIRNIKAYAGGYLSIPFDAAPAEFWRLAFPMPYRADLERYARQHDLDPFLLAALIRQESEFNPNAVSRARAIGLTQVMPATGRDLSRRIGIKRFRTSMLFTPAVNLQLGSYYLRMLLNSLNAQWEPVLASYNAGKSRVDRWLGWGSYGEPSEFIESIPIGVTRDYVMIIQRNADIYRRLYSGTAAPVLSENGITSDAPRRSAGATGRSAPKSTVRSGSKSGSGAVAKKKPGKARRRHRA
jgi:soluble lytic murein transglycosylase